jgi:hypothetical protein
MKVAPMLANAQHRTVTGMFLILRNDNNKGYAVEQDKLKPAG